MTKGATIAIRLPPPKTPAPEGTNTPMATAARAAVILADADYINRALEGHDVTAQTCLRALTDLTERGLDLFALRLYLLGEEPGEFRSGITVANRDRVTKALQQMASVAALGDLIVLSDNVDLAPMLDEVADWGVNVHGVAIPGAPVDALQGSFDFLRNLPIPDFHPDASTLVEAADEPQPQAEPVAEPEVPVEEVPAEPEPEPQPEPQPEPEPEPEPQPVAPAFPAPEATSPTPAFPLPETSPPAFPHPEPQAAPAPQDGPSFGKLRVSDLPQGVQHAPDAVAFPAAEGDPFSANFPFDGDAESLGEGEDAFPAVHDPAFTDAASSDAGGFASELSHAPSTERSPLDPSTGNSAPIRRTPPAPAFPPPAPAPAPPVPAPAPAPAVADPDESQRGAFVSLGKRVVKNWRESMSPMEFDTTIEQPMTEAVFEAIGSGRERALPEQVAARAVAEAERIIHRAPTGAAVEWLHAGVWESVIPN